MDKEAFERSFSFLLREHRKKGGFTQMEVAKYLGLTRSTYTYYESGFTSPSPYTLYRLAQLYQISVASFFPLVNAPSPEGLWETDKKQQGKKKKEK